MRLLTIVTPLLLLAVACSESPAAPEEPAPLEVRIDEPAEGAVVGAIEVQLQAEVTAQGELALARIVVGDKEQTRLRLEGQRQSIRQMVVLQPGANRIALEVEDTAGNTARVERQVTSQVGLPKIRSLVATPSPARPGQPVELRWEIEGDEPRTLHLAGVGAVEGEAVEVIPDRTTDYTLTLSNRWGSDTVPVQVVVEPELIPDVQVVAAGSLQVLRVAGLHRPDAFSVSGGTIERPDGEVSWRWQVPDEPGTYEIDVEHEDGTWSRSVEVRAVEPIVPRVVDVAALPAPVDCLLCAVVDREGRVWTPTAGGVARGRSGEGWELVFEGLEIVPRSLQLLADGRPLAFSANSGDDPWTLAVWDEDPGAWLPYDDMPPVELRGDLLVGLDGWQLFTEVDDLNRALGVWRRAPGGSWTQLQDGASRQAALAPDGTVYAAVTAGGFGASPELVVAGPDAPGFEPTGIVFPERLRSLHHLADGSLVAVGIGLTQIDPATGTVEDFTAGLEERCDRGGACIRALLEVDDRLFALTSKAIHERGPDGWVQLAAIEGRRPDPRVLLADGEGGLLAAGVDGVHHLPAGATTLRPYDGRGLIGPITAAAAATAGDGTVAIALGLETPDAPHLALLRPGETEWTQVGPTLATTREVVTDVAFDGTGRLFFQKDDALRMLPAGSSDWEAVEDLPPLPDLLAAWTALDDGTVVASVMESDEVYRLPVGASEWEALPAAERLRSFTQAPDGSIWSYGWDRPAHRLQPGASTWEPIAAHAAELPFAHRGARVVFDADGTPWSVALSQGVQRLEDGLWRPVGSGLCSMSAAQLFLGKGGEVFCATEGCLQHLVTVDGAEVWVDVLAFLPGTTPHRLIEGPAGQLWVSFDPGGLYEIQLP